MTLHDSKKYITDRQMKAARALLDWSQEDLAREADLSIATIRKIECGHISPRNQTMLSIRGCMEEAGVEFTETGVNLRNQDLDVIEGDDCYMRLLDDIYHTMKKKGGEILCMNADGSRENQVEADNFTRLRNAGIGTRILIEEGNTHINYDLDHYRWVPKKYFRYNLVIIYERKVAICVYGKNTLLDMKKVLIVNSEALAESMRASFEFMWENSRKPSHSTVTAR